MGNGEVASMINKKNEIEKITCPCGYLELEKCKRHGILSCILTANPVIGGVYKLRTSGFYSVAFLQSSIFGLMGLTNGNIVGIKFKLKLQMQESEYGPYPVAFLVYEGNHERLIERSNEMKYLLKNGFQDKPALLQRETEEEITDVVNEFMPKNINDDSESLPDIPKEDAPEMAKPEKEDQPEDPPGEETTAGKPTNAEWDEVDKKAKAEQKKKMQTAQETDDQPKAEETVDGDGEIAMF